MRDRPHAAGRGRCRFARGKAEAAAAVGARDVVERVEIDDFDRILAVGAADVHGGPQNGLWLRQRFKTAADIGQG